MPAAAVIPAPIAYIKVVAVNKLVVGFLLRGQGLGLLSGLSRGRPSSCAKYLCNLSQDIWVIHHLL